MRGNYNLTGAAGRQKHRFATLFSLLGSLKVTLVFIFLVACTDVIHDPSNIGKTASCHCKPWHPSLKVIRTHSTLPSSSFGLISAKDTPLPLAELIDIALCNNPQTYQAWTVARAAAYNLMVQNSDYYPAAVLQETIAYSKLHGSGKAAAASGAESGTISGDTAVGVASGGGATPFLRSLNSQLTISYLLLDFGGRRANVDSACQALLASNWMHNQMIQNVMLSVLQSYYLFLGSKALLEARKSDLKDSSVNLEAAKLLFASGITTKVDVLQAQSDYVSAELAVVESQGRVNISFGSLATSLGLPAHTRFQVEDLPKDLPTAEVVGDLDNLIDLSASLRPDLFAAWAVVRQKEADFAVIRSEGLPTLNANVNLQGVAFFNRSDLNTRIYTGSLVLSVPLFDGFYYWNQVKMARENIETARASFQTMQLQIFQNVLASYYDLKTAGESIRFSEEYLTYSQEAYDAALVGYKQGTGSILNVLTAQKTLSNARAQYIQSRTNWITALANVSYAVGMLGLYPLSS